MAKWIEFEEIGRARDGITKHWIILNKKSTLCIGDIVWDGGWRQYVVCPNGSTVWSVECLRDITDFIEQKTKEHELKKKGVLT